MQKTHIGDSPTGKSPADEHETTSAKELLFWIAVPLAMLVLFAVYSHFTGAK